MVNVCDFCNNSAMGLNFKTLQSTNLNICHHCIKHITIGEVNVRIKNYTHYIYLKTIKEITDDNRLDFKPTNRKTNKTNSKAKGTHS